MQKIFFRTDSSIEIGSGHVIRCLTLAKALEKNGYKCEFICRDHPRNYIEFIKKSGFKVFKLPSSSEDNLDKSEYSSWLKVSQERDAEECINILKDMTDHWIFVDHYGLDCVWENLLKPFSKKIFSIDDLANRKHSCDLLLDQTYGRKKKEYKNLVPKNCIILTGSEYALLRPEFNEYRKASLFRRNQKSVKNILINFGGVDKNNYTLLVLKILEEIDGLDEINFYVVLGLAAPNIESVQIASNTHRYNIDLKINFENIAELMTFSDLAIGAAGSSTWERCCLGLPTILLAIADNQKHISEKLKKEKMALYISPKESIKYYLPKYIHKCIHDKKFINRMSEISATATDGMGVKKIVSYINNINNIKI